MTTLNAVRTIVLADDVADLRTLLRMAIERSGEFSVVAEAGDGAAAVDAAREHQPDVLVLDLSMPVLDGLEALPLIKAAAPECAVVVLSGFSAGKMRQQVMDAGAAGYIEKGDIFEVVEAVRALVS